MNSHEALPRQQTFGPVTRIDASTRVWNALREASGAAADGATADRDWTSAERAAWALYAPLLAMPADRSFLFGQIGQSLDGRVATPDGDARDISGEEGLAHLHRCRALADAVVVGVGTAVADDPRLTVRLVDGGCPARVVIDPSGRLDDDAVVLRDDGCRRVVIQGCDRARRAGVEVVRLSGEDGNLDPQAIAAALHELGFRRALIEGGGITIGRFLDAGLLDRLHVGIAPLIIGAGPAGLSARAPMRLADAMRPNTRVFDLGGDILFDCAFAGGPAEIA